MLVDQLIEHAKRVPGRHVGKELASSLALLHLPDDMLQDGLHQPAEYAPGRLLHGAEQRQLLQGVDSIVILQFLRQHWRQVPGIRVQQEGREDGLVGAPGWEGTSLRTTWTGI